MSDPQENLIQAEMSLFAQTEALVEGLKSQDKTRDESRQYVHDLIAKTDSSVMHLAMNQFDMIWPEAP